MFGGAHVLILEDEPLVALDLAATVEAADGKVVGPFASVAEALAALDDADIAAAILDANLSDGEVTPVAMLLRERGIPVVVVTGKGLPDRLCQSHPDLPVYSKPAEPRRVLEHLSAMLLDPSSKSRLPSGGREGSEA